MKQSDFLADKHGIIFWAVRFNVPASYGRNTKTVWHRNPISGHAWSEQVPTKVWEVTDPRFNLTTKHNSEKAALKKVAQLGLQTVAMPRTLRDLQYVSKNNVYPEVTF